MTTHPLPDSLIGVEPSAVWRHFAAISAIPRASKQETAVVTMISDWARSQGFAVQQDRLQNSVIQVPGRGAGVNAPTTIIQGHIDMVCEKNAEVDHDFNTDPITLLRDGDWVHAHQTTLGADNAIGVSMGLAAAEGIFQDHPPLELLITTDEEAGMGGARTLDSTMLTGKRLINIDAEEEGVLYIGCAGGIDTVATKKISPEPCSGDAIRISITGLKGGHSGLDIHKNRGNAIRLLATSLHTLTAAGISVRICTITGGSKRNAIPREASALIIVPDANTATQLLDTQRAHLHALHADSEPNLLLSIDPAKKESACDETTTLSIIRYLFCAPLGILSLSQTIPDLVESSTNIGVVHTTNDAIIVTHCSRSSNDHALFDIAQKLNVVAYANELDSKQEGRYSGWQPDSSSTLLATAKVVFAAQAGGKEPVVTGIHAGLECGILLEKLPNTEMISFGPDITGAHSPDERVSIRSVAAVTKTFGALLRALC
jgi:dipeptidase D